MELFMHLLNTCHKLCFSAGLFYCTAKKEKTTSGSFNMPVVTFFDLGCDRDLFKARIHTRNLEPGGVIGHRHVAGVLIIPIPHA